MIQEQSEIWRPVIGYEGLYRVSNLGRVKNAKLGNILTPHLDKEGYCAVSLRKERQACKVFVHRLVLYAFIGAPLPDQVCRHKDNNHSNNELSNLYWDTRPRKLPTDKRVSFRKCDQDDCELPADYYFGCVTSSMYRSHHMKKALLVYRKSPSKHVVAIIERRIDNYRIYQSVYAALGKVYVKGTQGQLRLPIPSFRPLTITERQMDIHCVYRIVCKANSKVYVGQTNNVNRRRKRHFSSLRSGHHHSRELQRDYDRYGADLFTFEIIEDNIPSLEIIERETYWITHFDSCRNGYNMMFGDAEQERSRRNLR
ncbi:MAG: GIY-YIG nuclease family protein [Chloroflexota bacterium]